MRLASWLFPKRKELETYLSSRPDNFRSCKVIVVTNQKGGSFKTGWTVCYAHMFVNSEETYAVYGRFPRVAVIGMDPSCGVEKAFGLDAAALDRIRNATMPAALHHPAVDGIEPLVADRISHRFQHIHLYPTSPALSMWESSMEVLRAQYIGHRELGNEELAEAMVTKLHESRLLLKRFVDTIRGAYDRIIIDCRPGEGQLAVAPLFAADWVHIPTFLTDASITQARRRADVVKQAQQVNPALKIMAVIPTNLHKGNAQQRHWLSELSRKPTVPTKSDFSDLVVSPIWYNPKIDLIVENAQTRTYRGALQQAVGPTFHDIIKKELSAPAEAPVEPTTETLS